MYLEKYTNQGLDQALVQRYCSNILTSSMQISFGAYTVIAWVGPQEQIITAEML